MALQHFLCNIEETIAGSFCSDERSAIGQTFTGQHAFEYAAKLFVHTKHIADLTSAGTDIASRYVSVRANVLEEFAHEALAECHNFTVGFALWIEIGTAFAAADGQASQRVFEDLLETEEFNNTEVYRRMQTDAALIGADRAVVLNTVTAVDMNLAIVIDPRYTETDLALRIDEALQKRVMAVLFFVRIDRGTKRIQYFFYCLVELGLIRVLFDHLFQNFINVRHNVLLFSSE